MSASGIDAFIMKWRASDLNERSAAQEHFIDLCRLLGAQTPAEADPTGRTYSFEKGAEKTSGGDGFADVWRRGFFAWEYKRKHKDLKAAYRQLLDYREDLENPPLLVVCDTDRFEVHTNFTGTVKRVHDFGLEGLREPPNLEVLRCVLLDPHRLRPGHTPDSVTEVAARRVAELAQRLVDRGIDPREAAHFLVRVIFCLFAEDIDLLPGKLFTRIVQNAGNEPDRFARYLRELFRTMVAGGDALLEKIPWFDGGLFRDDTVLRLDRAELGVLREAAKLDWAGVSPAIFGTLFERSLNPHKRSQLGAHYTSPEDIQAILDPVVFAPLRRDWAAVRASVEADLRRAEEVRSGAASLRARQGRGENGFSVKESRHDEREARRIERRADSIREEAEKRLLAFLDRLAGVRVLDPACGSGNFLYLTLRGLKDLEEEVLSWAWHHRVLATRPPPLVSPKQLYGIELNEYAQQLAQAVVWIGQLQWMYQHAYPVKKDPVLADLDNIRLGDAIVDDLHGEVFRPDWPPVDFIVGNPPFLGVRKLRRELGDVYVERLFAAYEGRVSHESDLVCYWFERAREQIEGGRAKRGGLVATNSIRDRSSRGVLERIAASGGIFMAWSDRDWVQDGAAVRVSMVGFDDGSETERTLDGLPVARIHANLSSGLDLTVARRLVENLGLSFMGDTKGGSFELTPGEAAAMLAAPNPHARPNSEVVVRWANGLDVTRRPRAMWIVDFGADRPESEARLYEAPFEQVLAKVKPEREGNAREQYRTRFWIHAEPRPALRAALAGLDRYIATPVVAKHRLFVFLPGEVLPDHQLIVFARNDLFTFGVLHSKIHERWSLAMCSWLGVGNDPRYTPTTTFETFPFPAGVSPEARAAVEAAAAALDEHRGTRLAADPRLTMTGLYNKPPAWLRQDHEALDRAVAAAYGWDWPLPEEENLRRLLDANLARPAVADARRKPRKA